MADEFPVTDCFGRTVYLSDANWERHAAQRPEIAGYRDLLPLLLREPAIVMEAQSGHTTSTAASSRPWT
jgi:hypothetical protein